MRQLLLILSILLCSKVNGQTCEAYIKKKENSINTQTYSTVGFRSIGIVLSNYNEEVNMSIKFSDLEGCILKESSFLITFSDKTTLHINPSYFYECDSIARVPFSKELNNMSLLTVLSTKTIETIKIYTDKTKAIGMTYYMTEVIGRQVKSATGCFIIEMGKMYK